MLRSRTTEEALDAARGRVKGLLPDGLVGGDPSGGRKFRKRRGRHRVAGPLLIVCAVVAILVAADYWSNSGRIYRGVEVGPAAVGGETPQAARGTVEAEVGGAMKEVRLDGPQDATLSDEALDVSLDVEATLDRAYAVGREGNVFERLGERLDATWGTARIDPVILYDSGVARAEVEALAQKLNTVPREGTVSVSGDRVEVGESEAGYETDVGATLVNVERAIMGMTGEAEVAGRSLAPNVSTAEAEAAAEKARDAMSGPVTLTTGGEEWELSPAQIGETLSIAPEGGDIRVSVDEGRLQEALAGVYADLNVKPVEAGYKFLGEEIATTESRDGKEVESKKLLADLKAGLFEGQREYEVPVIVSQPKLTTEEAEKLRPTELLSTYRTNYTLSSDTSGERVENLRIASDAVSGTLLAPGEVFSFNELAAPLEYNETHVIVEGAETTANGGGLCQVASTLFNAANYAGLEIVERHPHFSELPYIRPGLDATVWFGALDMRFKNTTDGYVLVQESVGEDGYVYASIYGRPNGTVVEMDSEPTYRTEDASEWVTYKTVTRDGKKIFDGPMFTTSYAALINEQGIKIPPTQLDPAPVIP